MKITTHYPWSGYMVMILSIKKGPSCFTFKLGLNEKKKQINYHSILSINHFKHALTTIYLLKFLRVNIFKTLSNLNNSGSKNLRFHEGYNWNYFFFPYPKTRWPRWSKNHFLFHIFIQLIENLVVLKTIFLRAFNENPTSDRSEAENFV